MKYESNDDTFRLLISDNQTTEWNPIIFAIFYQKLDVLKYFCEHSIVYVRNCLTNPFLIESEEDFEDEQEEKFIKEKTEIFCLMLSIMLNDKHTFGYLWK